MATKDLWARGASQYNPYSADDSMAPPRPELPTLPSSPFGGMQRPRSSGLMPGGPPNTGAGMPTPAPRNRFLDSLMTPEALAAIGVGGFGLAGNIMNNRANSQDATADRESLERSQRMTGRAGAYGDQLTDNYNRDVQYMDTFAMDPVSQQRDLFTAAALRSLAGSGAPQIAEGRGVTNRPDFSGAANQFLSDDALAGNASRFFGAAGSLSNSAPPADLSRMGFGNIGENLQGGMNDQIMNARSGREQLFQKQLGVYDDAERNAQPRTPPGVGAQVPDGYEYDEKTGQLKKKGSGFWGKLGKIASIAAPLIAAPFTGGTSLALIGAGAGAASGALNGGGLRGALMGGALGAIPGMAGGGNIARSAGQSAMGAVGQNLARNPNALIQMMMQGAR